MTRFVYTAHLKNLSPMSVYEVSAGDGGEGGWNGMSKRFLIRTLPPAFDEEKSKETNSSYTTRIVVGGDVGMSDAAVKLFRGTENIYPLPHAFVIGGDLAYENAITTCYRRFDEWLAEFTSGSQHRGILTPVIPVVGNHDAGGFARKTYGAEALYFYYFPYLEEGEREADRDGAFVPISGEGVVVIEEGWKLREESYRVHDLESCSMSMVILDSNHVFSPEDQKEWLENELETRQDVEFKMVAYHDPLFPSQLWEYQYQGREYLRDQWFEIFGKYNVDVGFEFHTHQFKRSLPLLSANLQDGDENWVVSEQDEKILVPASESADISKGTVFIGDGCMGVEAHGEIENLPLPFYLEKAESRQHFLILDVTPGMKKEGKGGVRVQAVGVDGNVFDEYLNN